LQYLGYLWLIMTFTVWFCYLLPFNFPAQFFNNLPRVLRGFQLSRLTHAATQRCFL
jgi:hypothetical protein